MRTRRLCEVSWLLPVVFESVWVFASPILMGHQQLRRWIACPGSGQRPADLERTPYGWLGSCPTCGRRIAVSKRTERIYPHAATPPFTKR